MASRAESRLAYDLLLDKINACRACPLGLARTNAVPGSGNLTASLLFVGEGPGRHEDLTGSPFVGRAGELLDVLLSQIHLVRDDVYITNVVKCRPPDNRDPTIAEVATCRTYLEQQLELVSPSTIVTLGRHAFGWFFPDLKLSEQRGKLLTYRDRYILLPLYHPAAALRNSNFKQILFDEFLSIPKAQIQGLKLRAKG